MNLDEMLKEIDFNDLMFKLVEAKPEENIDLEQKIALFMVLYTFYTEDMENFKQLVEGFYDPTMDPRANYIAGLSVGLKIANFTHLEDSLKLTDLGKQKILDLKEELEGYIKENS